MLVRSRLIYNWCYTTFESSPLLGNSLFTCASYFGLIDQLTGCSLSLNEVPLLNWPSTSSSKSWNSFNWKQPEIIDFDCYKLAITHKELNSNSSNSNLLNKLSDTSHVTQVSIIQVLRWCGNSIFLNLINVKSNWEFLTAYFNNHNHSSYAKILIWNHMGYQMFMWEFCLVIPLWNLSIAFLQKF